MATDGVFGIRLTLRRILMATMAVCVLAAAASPSRQDIYSRLDSLIASQPQLIAAKEARLAQLKQDLKAARTLEARYDLLGKLYDEYAAYQYDSAYSYVSRAIRLAQSMGDGIKLNESRLNLAHILSTACLTQEAGQTLDQIDTSMLTLDGRIRYCRTRINWLIYQAEYMQGTQFAQQYINQLVALRHQIANVNAPRDNVNYLLTVAENKADEKRYDDAIAVLADLLKRYRLGDHMYSIITSTMSYFYQLKGDQDKQMECLIASAESDLKGCIRENTSFRMIAERLFDEGDIDRAYRYMRVAVDDANFYGTRLRNIQSSRIVPKILNAYQTKRDRNRRNMIWLLLGLSLIALMLVGGVITIYRLFKRSRRLNEQKMAINKQLQQVNARLEDTVGQLHQSNSLLRERERLKEEYIARFLTLSSKFIDRGEEQRKALYRLYRDRKTEELARSLKSTHFGSENAQLFYENFDNAFLNIYPNFVDEVNKLLNEDGQIEVKQGRRLTTEARVLALLRIGITDNQSIADILRASLTTIYTYRSKLKARARNKDGFEAQVKAIDG